MAEMHKVVIVGGGFGGVKAALELAKSKHFEITLVSDRDTLEYHAALYRSVTGRSKLEVAIPLVEIFSGLPVHLVEDSIVSVDRTKKTVTGANKEVYLYDKLILALGNVTAYFGIKGLNTLSYGIKSIEEATRLKDHLHDEMAHPTNPDNHYVIVGGGPTGIELAGEMVSYLNKLYKKHRVYGKTFQVDLVEAAPSLLPNLPKLLSARIAERLKGLGVAIFTDTAVQGETPEKLKLPHGSIQTHTVVWTAGVTGSPFFGANVRSFNLGKGNHAEVDEHLGAGDDIYVLGDAAHTQYTGWAQTALYDGAYVAANLKRGLRRKKPLKYKPKQPVGAIPVGPRWCAVATKHFRIYGYPGWLVRRYLDYKLYRSLLPPALARKTWREGNRIEESCPICAH